MSTLTTLYYFCKNYEKQVFRQFEIIINVLVSPFRMNRRPKLRVYGYYKYFTYFIAGIVVRRQNRTPLDVRFSHLKTFPALKGLRNE